MGGLEMWDVFVFTTCGEGAPRRAPGGAARDPRLVDDAVGHGLLGRHEEVAVAVVLDLVDGLARVVGDVGVELLAHLRGRV